MGRAIEIISGTVTNPGSSLAQWVMNQGDSAQVRNFNLSSRAEWEDAWASSATAGTLEVKSPKLHDNVQNVLLGVPAATPDPLLPDAMRQTLYPQDTLVISQSGGGSEVDGGSLLMAYDDLPGTAARLITAQQVSSQIKNYLTVQTNHTTAGTAGIYGGSVPINSVTDLLKANTDYALLGYSINTAAISIGWRCIDFGNLRIGGPATTKLIETRDYFWRKAAASGDPWIPVFNSANKGNLFVDLTSIATTASRTVFTYLAQIS